VPFDLEPLRDDGPRLHGGEVSTPAGPSSSRPEFATREPGRDDRGMARSLWVPLPPSSS
jgi:hypothetical protein